MIEAGARIPGSGFFSFSPVSRRGDMVDRESLLNIG